MADPTQLPGPEKPPKPPNPSEYTRLELVLYETYTVGFNAPPVGVVTQFRKGNIYIFEPEDALILLEQTDHGRPVWKLHGKPPKPKPAPLSETDQGVT